jgi:hypothetical protein
VALGVAEGVAALYENHTSLDSSPSTVPFIATTTAKYSPLVVRNAERRIVRVSASPKS